MGQHFILMASNPNFDISHPITIVLDGANYGSWMPARRSVLKGHKLWRVITEKRVKLTQEKEESSDKYVDGLEEWDSINHKIISWLINTSTPSIGALLHSLILQKKLGIFWQKGIPQPIWLISINLPLKYNYFVKS